MAHAQDPQYSQFYAAPTLLNPAFAGTSIQTRAIVNYRNQWPSIPGAFVSYNFSLDHYMPSYNSGMGLLFTHDKAGTGGLTYTNISGQYAYEMELKRQVFLRPALQFGHTTRSLDFFDLVFGDQLATGSSTTNEFIDERVSYSDFSAGLLLFSPRYWLGGSAHHINEPNQSLLGGESLVPIKYSVHGGYKFSVTPRGSRNPQSVLVAFNYKAQAKFDQTDIGFYYEYDPITLGIWYRGLPLVKSFSPNEPNNDAVIALFGYRVEDLSIGYSYDLTVSRLISNTGGSHEISIIYEFADRSRRKTLSRRKRVVPCAKF